MHPKLLTYLNHSLYDITWFCCEGIRAFRRVHAIFPLLCLDHRRSQDSRNRRFVVSLLVTLSLEGTSGYHTALLHSAANPLGARLPVRSHAYTEITAELKQRWWDRTLHTELVKCEPMILVMNWFDDIHFIPNQVRKVQTRRIDDVFRSLYTSGTFLAGIVHLVELFNINWGRLNPLPIRYPSHGIIGEEFGNLRADAKFVPWRGLRQLVYGDGRQALLK